MMEDTLRVDVISSTHNVRGEVKIFPTTDDVTGFKGLKEVMLDTGEGQKILMIGHVKFFENMTILKSKGYDNINDIKIYRGKDLLVPRGQMMKLTPNEDFIMGLIGLKVVTEDGNTFGMMTDVPQTGTSDIYVVETPRGKKILLPAIPSCILDVNLETSTMTIHILGGLLGL